MIVRLLRVTVATGGLATCAASLLSAAGPRTEYQGLKTPEDLIRSQKSAAWKLAIYCWETTPRNFRNLP